MRSRMLLFEYLIFKEFAMTMNDPKWTPPRGSQPVHDYNVLGWGVGAVAVALVLSMAWMGMNHYRTTTVSPEPTQTTGQTIPATPPTPVR